MARYIDGYGITGGRLKRVRKYLGDEDLFFTYGDGVAAIDVGALVAFHKQQGCMATITFCAATRPLWRAGNGW